MRVGGGLGDRGACWRESDCCLIYLTAPTSWPPRDRGRFGAPRTAAATRARNAGTGSVTVRVVSRAARVLGCAIDGLRWI